MPVQLTYPGVYVEEISSGVRAITGVSTSDTAFIDFFTRGPSDRAVRINSFADFERIFGGLDPRSEASYAIQQYYLNGGSAAWVVRVLAGNPATADRTLQGGSPAQDTLVVKASSPGNWGNNLRVAVDSKTTDPDNLFNMVVQLVEKVNNQDQVVASEVYRNLSMSQNSSRYAIDVINNSNDPSRLIKVEDKGLGHPPTPVTNSDVIARPALKDFFYLGVYGGVVGSDGDLPPAFPGDPKGDTWLKTTGANALADLKNGKAGFHLLDNIAPFIFNLMCIPAAANLSDKGLNVWAAAATYCHDRRAFLLVDIPAGVATLEDMLAWKDQIAPKDSADYAAVYFPRLEIADVINGLRPRNIGPSGTMAGIYARTDATRGVWKAPAGTDAALNAVNLVARLTDDQNGELNPQGINVLRNFPVFGNIAWGGRTLDGADQVASEWKYIPVRRTALFIEESLYEGLKWVVFEPNDEPLWAQIRLNVGAFMQNLFRLGAFQGRTPREAYFVKCDNETTTQNDINLGIVNILVGFAPLKPAEFVVIKIQQMAGQVEV